MDDIAQDPSSSTPAERVARGRAIWERYSAQHGTFAALEDAIADLLHLADQDVPGGAETVLDRAKLHHTAERVEPPLYDEHGNYSPAPGTEYRFSVSDIARATARRLGPGWHAEAGPWGVTGVLSGPYTAEFEFGVDYEGDLTLTFDRYEGDDFPETPDLPDEVRDFDDGVYLEGASASDGLDALADRAAAAIRAVTGYDPDDFDFESSASRQHHIDTGRYLRKGEAEAA